MRYRHDRRQIADSAVRSQRPVEPTYCRRDSWTASDDRDRQSQCHEDESFPAVSITATNSRPNSRCNH